MSTGGFIERVLSASAGNQAVISKYLTACKNLGYASLFSVDHGVSANVLGTAPASTFWRFRLGFCRSPQTTGHPSSSSLPPTDSSLSLKLAFSKHTTILKGELTTHHPDMRWGAGGDAPIEELESAGTRDPKWLIDRAKRFLDAGAYVRTPLRYLPCPRFDECMGRVHR